MSQYAAHWEAIGAELGLEHYQIANISKDHHHRIEEGCAAMLTKWLQMGYTPTWGTLEDAISEVIRRKQTLPGPKITVRSKMKPVVEIGVSNDLTADLKDRYCVTRLSIEKDSWPPEQLEEYTTLVLLHHKKQPTEKEVIGLIEAIGTGNVDQIFGANGDHPLLSGTNERNDTITLTEDSKCTRNIADILVPLEDATEKKIRTVLIEGAPGSGKTILLKQIAYEWAKDKQLLKSQFVFLLLLRDPVVRAMSSVTDIVKYFCKRSPEKCKLYADIISETNGKNVTFLLDGYDELPSQEREDSFIAKIIYHEELYFSAVVVSSRPHVSASLHSNALCQVDILGFTKDDQLLFCQNSLKDQPAKLKELQSYFDSHPTISSLCCIPFNITVLLWLFKQEIPLPDSSTELYKYLICHTIQRHLTKHKVRVSPHSISELNCLPQPYKEIIQQLSVLCLKALESNDLVFSLEHIRLACPDIDAFPNAFGLLQAVEHYSELNGVPTQTFSFIHVSVQEYLAAYQITCLSPKKELQFIKTNFFTKEYSNTFTLYVGMTKGQRPCFKKFLSCYGKSFIASFCSTQTNKIAHKFIEDNMTTLVLFQCFNEANNEKLCKNISKKMRSRSSKINLSHSGTLLPNDIRCLTLFLSKTVIKVWKTLDLSNCHIGDAGLIMLHESLITSGITIDKICLEGNSLTSQSSEMIIEIASSCKTKVFFIPHNTLEDGLDLSNNSTLEELYIHYNQISSRGASRIFATLSCNKNTRLTVLKLYGNSIGDETVTDIAQFLAGNNVLEQLSLLSNRFSEQGIVAILRSLYNNKNLKELIIGIHNENSQIMMETEIIQNNRPKLGIY